jgi:hypothetical protein
MRTDDNRLILVQFQVLAPNFKRAINPTGGCNPYKIDMNVQFIHRPPKSWRHLPKNVVSKKGAASASGKLI